VAFAGVLGKDTFGDYIEQRLRWANVNLGALRRVSEKTGITIWHEHRGRRAGVTYQGTIAMLRAADLRSEYLHRARHLHVGAYFLQERLHPHGAALFRRARRLGLSTSLDCNYDPKETWDSGIRQMLESTDVFLPNEIEARAITGVHNLKRAAETLAQTARLVVIKRGARGALISTGRDTFAVNAIKVSAIDTTGAGDSFNAGFLAAFLRGKSPRECAMAGVRAGARSVAAVGGTTAFE
jgi:sugar/nucleoside kinase (ribokinase family)